MKRREVPTRGELRARLIDHLHRSAEAYYYDDADRLEDRAGWLRKIAALEAHEPVVVAGWEAAPTVPAVSGDWLLNPDDTLIALSRDDLRAMGWDLR